MEHYFSTEHVSTLITVRHEDAETVISWQGLIGDREIRVRHYEVAEFLADIEKLLLLEEKAVAGMLARGYNPCEILDPTPN